MHFHACRICLLLTLLVMVLVSCSSTTDPPSEGELEPLTMVSVQGTFEVEVDFDTIKLTPAGSNCFLEIEGVLEFFGTLAGEASGKTTALIFAPCEVVAVSPPGTFRDVFMSQLVFEGTVNDHPVTTDMTYQGQVEEGGDITALIRFANGLRGKVDVDGEVAVGGSYSGFVKVK